MTAKRPSAAAIRRLEAIIARLEVWENSPDGGQRLDQGDAYDAAKAKSLLLALLSRLEDK